MSTLKTITEPTLLANRTENETDVVASVAALMRGANYPLTDLWLSETEIQEASGKNALMQRFLVTRNLRMKLGMATANTSIERFALDAAVDEPEYFENLKQYVIPALCVIAKTLN